VWAVLGHHLVGHIDLAAKGDEWLFEHAVPLELRPGDVLFHALSTPHGSRANISGKQRRTVYLHYVAEEVYQDGYAWEDWAKDTPGWTAAKAAHIEKMIADRKALGFEDTYDRGTIRLAEQGIEFTGEPKTPHRWWEELAQQINPEEAARMKKLVRLDS
jgi:hypothetical protein